tara:strand:+ start:873 stop:1406 length:534 start_codon:yes stop_codon:yes gene_type:complete
MSKKIGKEMEIYFNKLNEIDEINNEIKKTKSDLQLYKRINFDNNNHKKIKNKIKTLENKRYILENNIKKKLDPKSSKMNTTIIEGINKVNSLNTKAEKSFPDNSDAYKIGKKYYETKKKEEPKDEHLNQRPYLDIQKVVQQEKDIKRFEKAKKKGLTFGGKKTKHNRKNSKRKTRKV